MITLKYILTAKSRVSAGATAEVVNSRRAHTVIPGSTVRGALASVWVADHGVDWPDPDFRRLFEQALTVRQAVPERVKLDPMSLVSCKYPMVDEFGRKCEDERRDLALDVAEGTDPAFICPVCGGSWESGRGWRTHEATTVATTRTALNHGVAKDQELFTRRALERHSVLRGSLSFEESVASADELAWFANTIRPLRIGGQRSVLGAVEFSATRVTDEPTVIKRGLRGRLVLRAASPLIVTGPGGAATTDATTALQRVLGAGVTVVAQWRRPVLLSGWHMASGLPKPQEWALAAGSTFVVEGAPDDTPERLRRGVGLRRNEGFGDLLLVDLDEAPRKSVTAVVPLPQPSTARRVSDAGTAQPQPEASEGPAPRAVDGVRSEVVRLVDEIAVRLGSRSRTAIDGIGAGISQVRLRRQNGFHASASGLVNELLMRPWARDLSTEGSRLLRRLLMEPDLDALDATRAAIRQSAEERGIR